MDKFRCSACNTNFGALELFDDHRSLWKINRMQQLVGRCKSPGELGLVEHQGYWTTPEGVDKARRMSEVGRRRQSRGS